MLTFHKSGQLRREFEDHCLLRDMEISELSAPIRSNLKNSKSESIADLNLQESK
jgi:hypothetical protein